MTRLFQKLPFHYGWTIVFTGTLILFACLGLARFAYGMLLPAMRTGLGLNYDQIGFISTGNFAGYLIAVIAAPALIRRFKPQITIVGGLLLIGLGMLGISRSSSFQAVLVLYALIGVGSGFALIPAVVLVSHWFRPAHRGLATGLMFMGVGPATIFAALYIPTLNGDQSTAGWRSGWLTLGLITLVIALISALLLRNDPAEIGREPFGKKQRLLSEKNTSQEKSGKARVLVHLGLLHFLFGITYMVYGTFIVTTMVEELSFPEARAGMFWAGVGFFSIFSGIGFGLLSDRISRRGGLAAVFFVQTASYLLVGLASGSPVLLFLSVVLYGLSIWAVPTIMAAAVSDHFGVSHAARAFSAATLFFAVGQTLSTGAAGLIGEATKSFTSAYLASASLTCIAFILAILLPRASASR
ncbi:MAG: YbfB/YjiJ family MFS transporter [Desulfobacterales bacterium]